MGVSAEKTFSSVCAVDWFAPMVVVTAICGLEGMAVRCSGGGKL